MPQPTSHISSIAQCLASAFRHYLALFARATILPSSDLLGPDEIKVMTEAYEGALSDWDIADRNDSLTELIAKSIVNVTAAGERDPILVKERAINALGVRRPSAA
jgi:hypothetical protein